MRMELYKRYTFGVKTSALLETLLLLTLMVVGDAWFGEGSRFLAIEPHPFWIVILLSTVYYGVYEALAAAFLATLFLYTGNIPIQWVTETTFDYQWRLFFNPVLWFAAAFFLGQTRTLLGEQLTFFKEQNKILKKQAKKITDAFEELKKAKETLEKRLVSEATTVARSYELISEIENSSPVQLLHHLDRIIKIALDPEKFSIYASGPQGLEATRSFGWEESENYKRRFLKDSTLYDAIVLNKNTISIHSKKEEEILNGEGVIAVPLIDQDSQVVFGMLKIEAMKFQDLNTSRIRTVKNICEMIGTAYAKARKNKFAIENAIYDNSTFFYSQAFFSLRKQELLNFAKRYEEPLWLITLSTETFDKAKQHEKLLHTLIKETFKDESFYKNPKEEFFKALLFGYSQEEVEQLCSTFIKNSFQNISTQSLQFRVKYTQINEHVKKEEIKEGVRV